MEIPIPTTAQDIFSYGFNKGLYRTSLYPETGIDSLDEISETSNLESNVIVGGTIRTVAQGGRLEITSENVRTIAFYDSEDEMESMIQSDSNPNLPGIDMTAVNNKEYLIDPSLENWTTSTNLTYWTEDGVSAGTRDIDKESTEIDEGIYSAKLTATANDGTDFGIYQDFSWGDDMATEYVFRCSYKITSRTAGKIKMEAYNQTDGASLGTAEGTTTGSWQYLRMTFTANFANKTIRFKIYFEDETDGVLYIDNISVKVLGSMIRLDNNWAYMTTDKFEVYGAYASEAFQFLCDGLADTYSFNFSADNQADLGTSTYQFKDLYIDGKAYIDELGEFPLTPSSAPTNDYDVANKKYVDDSTETTISVKAGEAITSGQLVCIKPKYVNVSSSKDAYVQSDNPDTNYGSETAIYIGANAGTSYSYIDFDLSAYQPYQILKAELCMLSWSGSSFPRIVHIVRVTSSWTEGAITWNNQPTYDGNVVSDIYGDEYNPTSTGTGTWFSTDITNVIRGMIAGKNIYGASVGNYGLRITGDVGGYVVFKTKEFATESHRPYLRVWLTNDIDTTNGYVYKTDCSDYLLCRQVLGIATENISSGNSGSVQIIGEISNGSGGGFKYVSDTPGTTVNHTSSLARNIKVGTQIDTNLLLDIQRKDICIGDIFLYDPILETATARYWYVPSDARYADVKVHKTSENYEEYIRVYKGSAEKSKVTAFEEGAGYQFEIDWTTSSRIKINPTAVARVTEIYLYS